MTPTPAETLKKNYDYVKANFDTLLNLYRNKYLLVFDREPISAFDTYEAAATQGIQQFGPNSGFLVHYITETAVLNFIMAAK
jgi:hypothetical protein